MALSTMTKKARAELADGGVVGPGHGPLVRLEGVEKVYRTGRLEYPALRGVDLTVDRGELVAIAGPSGSGKSTILNILTGIDRPTSGTVTVGGMRIDEMSEEELAAWRGENVGIVFQFFQLLPMLTALENAVLPLEFAGGTSWKSLGLEGAESFDIKGLSDDLKPGQIIKVTAKKKGG